MGTVLLLGVTQKLVLFSKDRENSIHEKIKCIFNVGKLILFSMNKENSIHEKIKCIFNVGKFYFIQYEQRKFYSRGNKM